MFCILLSGQGNFIIAAAEKGQATEYNQQETKSKKNIFLKIKVAYFQPTNNSFNEIYTNKWMGEGEFSLKVYKFVELWLSGSYYNSNGKLLFSQESTKFTLMGISSGLRFRANIGAFNPYIGLGPLIYFYEEKNPIGTAKGNNFGYIGQAGFYLFLSKRVFLDFSLAYSKCDAKQQQINADLGGIQGAIGLGFAF